MSRSMVAIQRAPGPDKLALLPRTSIQGTHFREHQARPGEAGGCWWFSGTNPGESPAGRFDLPAPRGTLYLAGTVFAAALERCGRYLAYQAPIPVSAVEGRVVSSVEGRADGIGDLTHEGAAKVGVTREISTVDDYPLTVTWAVGVEAMGLAGLMYQPRFSTSRETAVALFGDRGTHAPDGFAVTAVSSLAEVLASEGIAPRMIPTEYEAADDEGDDVEVR